MNTKRKLGQKRFVKIIALQILFILVLCPLSFFARDAYRLLDHKLVLDEQGRLLPWTNYDYIFKGSMNFIKQCPTTRTIYGDDPLFLVTSSLDTNGRTGKNQNNQGGNTYWAVETLRKYYYYTGDRDAIAPVRLLLDRVLMYHTPSDWAWPNVPRTQDNSPDGEYTDHWSGVDKICMVAVGYIRFYKLTGEEKYLDAAIKIAETVAKHVGPGGKMKSPLPFRVNLENGKVIDCYTANMVYAVMMFDELIKGGYPVPNKEYKQKRDLIWGWILEYPMKDNVWSGYYEDVKTDHENYTQQIPMETARYILNNPEMDPEWKTHVPELIDWVEKHFGQTKHWGATSIREQNVCYDEMGSHTSRYASIAAMWYGVTKDLEYKEEARASFAISTYSTFTNASWGDVAVNRTGIGYARPWFSDSYFDFLSHFFDGIATMPGLAPNDKDHILNTSSTITDVDYSDGQIEYNTYDNDGEELIKLTFEPEVYANGKLLDKGSWSFGDYNGEANVLQIHRKGIKHVTIRKR